MPRERLHNRRMSLTDTVRWQETANSEPVKVFVTVGFFPDGRVGEIFLDCAKSGTLLRSLLHDASILASLCLQHGGRIEDIAASMSKIDAETGQDASPIGQALSMIAKLKVAA